MMNSFGSESSLNLPPVMKICASGFVKRGRRLSGFRGSTINTKGIVKSTNAFFKTTSKSSRTFRFKKSFELADGFGHDYQVSHFGRDCVVYFDLAGWFDEVCRVLFRGE